MHFVYKRRYLKTQAEGTRIREDERKYRLKVEADFFCLLTFKVLEWDFPGDSVVKMPHFQSWEYGFDHRLGN